MLWRRIWALPLCKEQDRARYHLFSRFALTRWFTEGLLSLSKAGPKEGAAASADAAAAAAADDDRGGGAAIFFFLPRDAHTKENEDNSV